MPIVIDIQQKFDISSGSTEQVHERRKGPVTVFAFCKRVAHRAEQGHVFSKRDVGAPVASQQKCGAEQKQSDGDDVDLYDCRRRNNAPRSGPPDPKYRGGQGDPGCGANVVRVLLLCK
jgi:hypothetical protein